MLVLCSLLSATRFSLPLFWFPSSHFLNWLSWKEFTGTGFDSWETFCITKAEPLHRAKWPQRGKKSLPLRRRIARRVSWDETGLFVASKTPGSTPRAPYNPALFSTAGGSLSSSPPMSRPDLSFSLPGKRTGLLHPQLLVQPHVCAVIGHTRPRDQGTEEG